MWYFINVSSNIYASPTQMCIHIVSCLLVWETVLKWTSHMCCLVHRYETFSRTVIQKTFWSQDSFLLFFSSSPKDMFTYVQWEREIDRETERQRETLICCSTYWCIHWLLFPCVLSGDQTCNLGISKVDSPSSQKHPESGTGWTYSRCLINVKVHIIYCL